jgi:small conductance mechanosensitive channel
MPKKKENTNNQIFTTTSKIGLMTIAGLMVLQEFGVEIAPYLAAAGIVGLAFVWRSIPHQRYYFWFYYS